VWCWQLAVVRDFSDADCSQVLSLLNARIDSVLQALGAIAVDSPARLDDHVRVRTSPAWRDA
jgi:hypothetical protein